MNYPGLTTKQARKQLALSGYNEISEGNKVSAVRIFLTQLKSPLVYILILASIFSLALGEYKDAIFILAVVVINSILGFYQEYKAENALEALKKSVSKTIKVIRDGQPRFIDTRELVPGDLFVLTAGTLVPCDALLVEANEMLVNEALLTGESEPVEKAATSHDSKTFKDVHQVFMGSTIVAGLGYAKALTTGEKTKFGKIAHGLRGEFDPPNPIKEELMRIGRIITIAIVFISALIVVLGIIRGIPFNEIFLTAVSVGVSTIPEGLLISLTVTLALGMSRIMSKQAIVKNLPAAETLGDIDVLCVDKTGTLTLGVMEVTDSELIDRDLGMRTLAICNNGANFIDEALLEYLHFSVADSNFIKKVQNQRAKLFPFSSQTKYTGAADGKMLYATGAPEVILGFCSEADKAHWHEKVRKQAKLGSRLIALAYKEHIGECERNDFHSMHFLGLIYIKDPVRPSVAAALQKISSASIEVKVITGDLKETAINVLNTVKFAISEAEIMSGAELEQLKTSPDFDRRILATKLFYRTSPDQKLDIVRSLQKSGKRVGMMGDGINDSPALKNAEIGISVDSATDVSKEASDLVLLDSDFATIVAAIEEGRNIFSNLRKILTYLFADSMSETILIVMSLLFKLPLPLLPLQLLWINLIEDGLPSLSLSFEKPKSDLLQHPPRPRNSSILDRKVVSGIVAISLVIDVLFFLIFSQLLTRGYDLQHAQTMIFAGISISSLLFLFSAKTVDSNIWKERIWDNRFMNISFVLGFVLLFAALYWPPLQDLLNTVALTVTELGFITVVGLIHVLVVELIKLVMHHRFRDQKSLS